MDAADRTDDEQEILWNGTAGRAWVDAQELLDLMFRPMEELLIEAVRAGRATRVLDVGCGTGSTTLAAGRVLAARGSSTGIDISEPMIAAARARVEPGDASTRFICANAQFHEFEPGSFDTIISRFGVMFFDDPVRAFGNLRRAASDNAALRFIAWRSAAENPFMTTAERAAAPLLPDLPARQPGAQGQFAFADPQRIHRILAESGWDGIDIRPIDVTCTFAAKDLDRYLTRLGPVGLILQQAYDQTRAKVIETVLAAFQPFVFGAEVRFDAACWRVAARATPAASTRGEAANA